ncbi:MFS transporter [Ferviditalea candida]|uniref:MFS transporter n=1 Tax=Ferviditalea candida TaxID=3108399 RepID=A0ABU5ZCQ7_9BACL|nr:MFS transporter [Paenibacillaceae bacterium T2]
MQKWKINLIVLWFGQFMVMSGMTMIVPFMSLYLQELGVTDPHQVSIWAGVIFAGTFVTSFIFQPIWGRLADRYGRKMMLLRSGIGMAIVMTLMGFVATPWHLLLLRVLNGTISGFVPAATALISTTTPKEKMGYAMGTLQSGVLAGSILGPFIGGLAADWFGFRPLFYVTGALIFLASMLAFFLVTDRFDPAEAARKPSISVMKGLDQLRRIPQLPSLFTVTFLIQFSIISSMPLLPLFVQQIHNGTEYLAFFAGLVGSVTGFSNMIASPLLGRYGDKLGAERILRISLIGAGLSFIPQAMVTNIWQLLAARFLLGIFLGGLLPTVNSLIRLHTPDGMESRAFSFNTSSLSLGNMLGPIVGGVLSGWITIRGIFVVAALLLLLNAVWVKRTLFARKSVGH